ncbi:neurogenic locus notch homolog protein 1-like [Physella acuta]|uniref:neurogenic locus notch homolog protein 1-like n=1 Tax=Physella acuta TaxID=109671 RepID=UPI0027DB5B01|nr:neurogenic locus notch homolog protein 1-like [Physella acuta]
MTNSSGIINLNYIEPYISYSCWWTIVAPPEQVVTLQLAWSWWGSENWYLYNGPNSSSEVISPFNNGYWGELIARSTGNVMYIMRFTNYQYSYHFDYYTHECPPSHYGMTNCNNPCTCEEANTEHCNMFNGNCQCKPNWFGSDCSVDPNECENPLICTDIYSYCNNTRAGYDCLCKPGLAMNTSTGECYECGKVFTEPTGNIETRAYAYIYLNTYTSVCSWTIVAPPGQVVSV